MNVRERLFLNILLPDKKQTTTDAKMQSENRKHFLIFIVNAFTNQGF